MHPLYNLVCTNSLDGDHSMLQRWYADHISLLLRFDGLQEARLLQRTDVQPGLTATQPAPHYACLYTFASPDAFEAFEVSDARANAGRLGRPDWMSKGLAIVLRQQFQRLTLRASDHPPPARRVWQLQSFGLDVARGSDAMLDAERWLQGAQHLALQTPGTMGTELQRRTRTDEAKAQYLALLELDAASAAASRPLDLPAIGQADRFGPAPVSGTTHWQGCYQLVGHWKR